MGNSRTLKVTMKNTDNTHHSVEDTDTLVTKAEVDSGLEKNPFFIGEGKPGSGPINPMWVRDDGETYSNVNAAFDTKLLNNNVYCPLEPGEHYYLIRNRVVGENSSDFFCIIPLKASKRGNKKLNNIIQALDYNIYTQTRTFSNTDMAILARESRVGMGGTPPYTEVDDLTMEGVTNNIAVKGLDPDGTIIGVDDLDGSDDFTVNNVAGFDDLTQTDVGTNSKVEYSYKTMTIQANELPMLDDGTTVIGNAYYPSSQIIGGSQQQILSEETQEKLRSINKGGKIETYPYAGIPGSISGWPVSFGYDTDGDGYEDSWKYSTIAKTDEDIIAEILSGNNIVVKQNLNQNKIGRHPSAIEHAPQLSKFGEFTSLDYKNFRYSSKFNVNNQLFRFAHEWVSVPINDSVNNNRTCAQICEIQQKRCINHADDYWLPTVGNSPQRKIQMDGKDFTVYEEPVLSCEPIYSAWPPEIVDNIDWSNETFTDQNPMTQTIEALFRHGGFLYGHQSQNHYEYNSCDHEFGQVGPVDEGNFDSLLCCCAPLEYSDDWYSSVEEQDFSSDNNDTNNDAPNSDTCVECGDICGQCGAGLGTGPCLEDDCNSLYCNFNPAYFQSGNTCTPKDSSVSNCCP